MARHHTAAGFVKKNMPLGQGNSLTDEEAWNVAAYFTTQPRPDFKKKLNDWKSFVRLLCPSVQTFVV